jgi:hypothetical protein
MKVGEHKRIERAGVPELGVVAAMMVTYDRPGMLLGTVRSYFASGDVPELVVFDDGSGAEGKDEELREVASLGAVVMRMGHSGFIGTWRKAFEWAREVRRDAAGFVLLEDDLRFAPGWVGVLRRMHGGAADRGLKPGAMSCLMAHGEPQGVPVLLRGVEAYQSMMHGFQVNLVPREAVLREDVFEEAARASAAGRHGLDVHWLGLLSHRLWMTNFVSTSSWVSHEGAGRSVVAGQGYRSLESRGDNLVEALRQA